MKLHSPCLTCGHPTKPGPRCEECTRKQDRMRIRKHSRKASPKSRGYDEKWRRLSERARKAQPFCSDCGATTDLQGDHSPEAWVRHEQGLPLRLQDIDVVCGPCNRARGAARGSTSRSKALRGSDDTGLPGDTGRPSGVHTAPGEGPLAGHRPDSAGW